MNAAQGGTLVRGERQDTLDRDAPQYARVGHRLASVAEILEEEPRVAGAAPEANETADEFSTSIRI